MCIRDSPYIPYPDICLEGLKKFGMSFVDKFEIFASIAPVSYTHLDVYKKQIYTKQLRQNGELITHNKDESVFVFLRLDDLIQDDGVYIHPSQTLEMCIRDK